jgi:hypothetical protein
VDWLACRYDMLILGGVVSAKFGWKDIDRGLTDQLLFMLKTASSYQGVVGHHIAASRILHEENDIGELVEERFGEERIRK